MAFLVTLCLVSMAGAALGSVVKTPQTTDAGKFELLILHNNDMHARFEQTSQLSGACTAADRDAGKCYGGFPRVATVVKEARAAAATGDGPPVLYLNAGDTYTGTAWFTIYKWKIAAEFINALQPDAVALGNNELVKGSSNLSPFLEELTPTILASNVIINTPESSQKLEKSIVFDINNVKVGIVGYLGLDNQVLDGEGVLEYIDEVIAVRSEVEKLQNDGVQIIIALGHSTAAKDIEIAKEVDGIDLVISGDKNIFLWNGKTTNAIDEPVTITQESGKTVPIISSHAYDKYLGKILVSFNDAGEILQYNAEPILLDERIPQEKEFVQLEDNYRNDVVAFNDEVVGTTAVVLDGETCRWAECNLGNLITDAMMFCYATRFVGERWTDAPIAIIPGRDIAASIAPTNRPASVTWGDLQTALPAESNIVAVTMTGTILNQLLEAAVADYTPGNSDGLFLQYSGIRVEYDLSNEPGSRMVSAVVRCWSCYVPEYYVIDTWRDYKILMPASMAQSGTGFDFLEGLERDELTLDELTLLAEYIELRSPVYPDVAGRILLHNAPEMPEPEIEVEPEIEPEAVTELTTSAPVIITEAPGNSAPALRLSFVLVFISFVAFLRQ